MSLDIYFHATRRTRVYDANITHNLTRMADAAGIYEVLWRPEEIGVTHAEQLIEPLQNALNQMLADPEKFKKFDSPNGWGIYEHFIPWLQEVLKAAIANPDAEITVSR